MLSMRVRSKKRDFLVHISLCEIHYSRLSYLYRVMERKTELDLLEVGYVFICCLLTNLEKLQNYDRINCLLPGMIPKFPNSEDQFSDNSCYYRLFTWSRLWLLKDPNLSYRKHYSLRIFCQPMAEIQPFNFCELCYFKPRTTTNLYG